MRYLRGFEALRNDPQVGNKLLIASLLMFIQGFIPLVPGIVVVGWLAVAVRRAAQGQHSPMPPLSFDMELLGKLLGYGFKPFLAGVFWALPLVVVFSALYVTSIAVAMAGVGIVDGDPDTAPVIVLGVVVVLSLVGLAAMLLLSMPMQIAVLRVELTENLNEALAFGPILSMTRMLSRELLVGIMLLQITSIFLFFAGMLLFCVGMYPAQVLAYALWHYYRAELYDRYLEKGGEPLPIATVDLGVEPQPAAPTTF